MRPLPWLPVLLLLALAAYLLPEWRPAPAADRPPPPPVTQTLPNRLPENTRELFTRARPAVVRVESLNPGRGEEGIGTGFFISATGQVLTAYHVVGSGKLFQVQTLSGRRLPARVAAYDAQADVALLEVEGRGPFPVLNLATRPPRVGETVLAIGNSGGDFLQPRRGQLLRLGAEAGRADFPQGTLEMSAPLAPGDSGGPILDGNGQAIGVVSYIRVDDSGQTRASYAVPVTEGNDLITALRAGRQRDVPVVGLVLDVNHSGLTDPPGGVISRIARGSPAAHAGLRGAAFDANGNLSALGDVITSVNGQRTRDANEVISAIRQAGVGDTVTLGYVRSGEARQARITLVGQRTVPDLNE
ncbi:peptidase S1 and S6, chymotrypsin/Hap [Deinococcus phoenicis]|uniref:Peptidase S1 and S6, chymotrypsin/Hap n=1 Tax=Deinococcus phoenicis TaxID=1476583 RepID=A0A016QU92_9DEIO|nr:S1C family serine protease [Deinococcus phoenicis]EYB69638.1 peptidase S1 and S6, chymotrypsin/Hap [Deinococcus phoenicis]